MALFRKFFYRKPPDGLLEISERVYVFDCCFTTDVLEEDEYKVYIGGMADQLRDQFPDASFMVFNFRDGENQSLLSNILSEYDMTVMDYPRHYEGCPLLTMEAIHHFLRSSESWLSLGQQNVLLMHCERGGWLVLAFMLAALLIYRNQYTGEHKTLDMIYKQAPRELLQLMSPLNPMPSQLRYLQYITRRNVGSEWPPLDRALTLDCIIIRCIPNMGREGGHRPIFRIYGQDPFMAADRTPKVLFSTPKRSKLVRHYKQADCELVKIDIHCHIQGDVVLECISLDSDLEREEMMFRIMFNTAFIRSNILMLNREDIDILWNVKDQFPKDFRAEVLFSEMDAASSLISIDLPGMEEKDGLPVEAFAKVQEMFSNVDWLDPKADVTHLLQKIASSGALHKLDSASLHDVETGSLLLESTPEKLKSDVKSSENDIKSPTFVAQGKHDSASGYTTETGSFLLESTPEKLRSEVKSIENDVRSLTYLVQGKHDGASAHTTETGNLLVESLSGKVESEPKATENIVKSEVNSSATDIKSTTSLGRGKHDSASVHATETANLLVESLPECRKTEPKASENSIRSPPYMALGKLSISNIQPSLDSGITRKKIEPQDLQAALLLPTHSKIISQRARQGSLSAPVSYGHSLQGLPVPISRYQSAPSALGITALLQDHAAYNREEEIRQPETVSPPSHATSAPDLTLRSLPKSVQPGKLSFPAPPPSSLQFSGHATVEKISVATPPSPLPPELPQQTSNSPQSLFTERTKTTLQGRGQSAFVPLPPPPPPPPRNQSVTSSSSDSKGSVSIPPPPAPPHFSGASPSSPVKNSVSAPPPPPPPPSFSGSSPSLSVKNLISSLPPPLLPSFLEKSPSSSLKNSSSAPFAPPPPSSFPGTSSSDKNSVTPPTPPLPPPSFRATSSSVKSSVSTPPPPPPPPFFGRPPPSTVKTPSIAAPPPPPPPPPPPGTASSAVMSGPPPPPPPPLRSGPASTSTVTPSAPPPLPPQALAPKESLSQNAAPVPPVPPPPLPNGVSKSGGSPTSDSRDSNGNIPSIPGPPSGVPFSLKGRGLMRPSSRNQPQPKKANLKPYHWLKLTRAMHGSLWAEAQKADEATKPPEFDMKELESLFSAAAPNSDHANTGGKSGGRAKGPKSEKVHLIELRRAYNCEIMLTKVKIPLPDLMSSVLALDDSALDIDQVENLIKFCPTKEEMELLKGYNGDKENLGKCEQFFLELMKVPRVEPKLRVFSFKIQFHTQVSDLRKNLNTVNSVADEIRSSEKLKRIMQTILSLGNALNHGTARGSAIGFRLDSLLKLTDTRARNNKMTLMHYLCKVLAEKLPELLDFPKDLVSLEASTKVQLKYLAEEMQAINKGLEKVVQELTASEKDGPVSETFCKTLKEFLGHAEAEVRSLASLYSSVGRNADALALYFGEDPARCPFEQVVSTLLNFVKLFVRAHEENCKQLEFEKKKALKEAENEKMKSGNLSKKESERLIRTQFKSANIKS